MTANVQGLFLVTQCSKIDYDNGCTSLRLYRKPLTCTIHKLYVNKLLTTRVHPGYGAEERGRNGAETSEELLWRWSGRQWLNFGEGFKE